MADDLFDGVLRSDDEKSEAATPEAPASAEAFAAAIAAIASRQDPQVAHDTSIFLKKQTRLLDLQAQHLEDEHATRLTHLHLTVAAAKRKRYADRMRNALYTGIGLLVLGVLLAATRMTVQAMTDHSLVVEDFTVPADFAARGVTSQALAEDLATRVSAIRAEVNRDSVTTPNEVRADQAGILKVQIPETGVSVGELERFMHRWLGHQTQVNGELRDEAAGQVSIVLHIAGIDPIVVRGPNADLDRLMQATAEEAYAVFDPGNDIIYLCATGRDAECYGAAVRYAHSPGMAALPSLVRARAYALLSLADPDRRRALSSALIAVDIDPRATVAWDNAFVASVNLGHDQAALDFARKMLGTKRAEQLPQQQDGYPRLINVAHTFIDNVTGDFGALQGDVDTYLRTSVPLSDRYAASARLAANLHDVPRSQQQLARAQAAGPSDLTVLQAQWSVSSGAGDWPQALTAAQALVAATEAQNAAAPSPEVAIRPELALETQYRPLLAYAEAMTGDTASATALISQTPTDCYLCVHTRAMIAAAAGDAAGADRWFNEAVRQAPDLPAAYFEWGQALAARGDLTEAVRELALAHDKGPHFADPLKAWGDVLVEQGQRRAALAKYDEALRDAPNWAALKQAREAAAQKRGTALGGAAHSARPGAGGGRRARHTGGEDSRALSREPAASDRAASIAGNIAGLRQQRAG